MKVDKKEWEELSSVCMDYHYGCVIVMRDNETFIEEHVDSLKPGDIVLGSISSLEDPKSSVFDNIPKEYRNMFHEAFERNFDLSLRE